MFRGVHHLSIDAKGRLAMPARQRDRLHAFDTDQLVATIDTQHPCVLFYPLPIWEEVELQLQALPTFNSAARRFQRLMVGYATDLECDGNGRVLLPSALREYAGLDKKAVLVGQGKKMELWDEEKWLAELDACVQMSRSGEAVPEELLQLSL